MKIIFNFCFIVSVLVIFAVSTDAGDMGKITGIIIDAETKELIPGAMIQNLGTTNWTSTDSSGNFVIDNIPFEICSLQISMPGFLPKKKILPKDTVKVDNEGFYKIKLQFDPKLATPPWGFPDKPMIVPDQTQTIRTWNEKEIKRMPGN
ncbi:MAG: hypothetical protein A2509_01240 [Candidatus Edwardsbacteria bacterium RIFOXYD12_FULL_50_11]|uniref:Carboxypeptidase regulatory-like domain-containing protein n=1 Tax=Candidatus Edwardsbacteria bacterium GWF2_54_11 TaxID=1817851 RepID=A0A1F5RCG2_9BACT|nr:MAG: hypothetical protein A2502_07240 [Candidatus Edwardsbacteria bacterium RifOxyC12_full_54_24]OGF07605.1 MAG: hypothetical protein A2273_03820 [Candidatus Edwardsbacteria bacterium RifOxyA12_full_54_48]OGF09856.1 MAG: hypothetical protein A3K15_10230 [Candidatus Edwardsbacteria bacterium GWE2_54_12]OGF12117.1 MAG: hypothetical protein A2024_03785 [Candidatus Edwardsbacteria bacterium GWF2_54_11]OGF16217.1 MAG: hypothetical protein A2509_01240 [Candidatus Edwardsbacteria bacterium RIFOXYD1